MENKFPMGAWIYKPISKTTKEDVELWRDCGLTLSFSPNFDYTKDDKQKMLDIMDYCYECGIKLIVCDSRASWKGAAQDPDGYRERFKQAYADFGHHKATWGFHVGDEPYLKDKEDVLAAYKIQCEEAPELVPFINFLPFWKPEVEEYTAELFPKLNPKLLCYDCYNQMSIRADLRGSYFRNLKMFKEYADEYGVPLWTTLLSMGHMGYAEPTEDDFRWQLNTAVACGCEGILWFHFYTPRLLVNYRNGPINKFGEKTKTYTDMSYVLREFHLLYGDYFKNGLKLQNSYHVGKDFGGYPLFKQGDSEIVLDAVDTWGTEAILSFFKDSEGKDYLAVVNNSKTNVGNLALTISKSVGKMIRLGGEQEVDVSVSFHDEKFEQGEGSYTYTAWLAPGQMNLFRFEK